MISLGFSTSVLLRTIYFIIRARGFWLSMNRTNGGARRSSIRYAIIQLTLQTSLPPQPRARRDGILPVTPALYITPTPLR